MTGVICILIALIGLFGVCYFIYHSVWQSFLFKNGHNPFHRICKKCGAHQNMYQSNIEGCEDHIWWEEVYPIGNNEKCKCHKYSEYHK